jgi:L-iditol 2-dehydrogenase
MTALGGGFRVGDTVTVLGLGPLGLMHLAKADMLGAGRLIAIDLLAERLELAEAFGAEVCLDATATTPNERLEAVRAVTAGLGADVVVVCSGVAATFTEALELVRPGGAVIEAGAFVDMGSVPVNPNRHICAKSAMVIGIGGEALEQYGPSLRMLARYQDRLPFGRAVTHRVGLEEVEQALELAQTGAAMKVLVAPNGEP